MTKLPIADCRLLITTECIKYFTFSQRSAGFQTCCIADFQAGGAWKLRKTGGFGNPRYGRLGSPRYKKRKVFHALGNNRLFGGSRFAGGCHDGGQSIRFFEQGGKFFCRHNPRLNQQFQPQGGLIGFFFNRANFGNELRSASRPTRRAVVRGRRSSAADDLFGDGPSRVVIFGDRAGQFYDSQGKGLGAGFQFDWVHGTKLQIQSAIGNRQSAITR